MPVISIHKKCVSMFLVKRQLNTSITDSQKCDDVAIRSLC